MLPYIILHVEYTVSYEHPGAIVLKPPQQHTMATRAVQMRTRGFVEPNCCSDPSPFFEHQIPYCWNVRNSRSWGMSVRCWKLLLFFRSTGRSLSSALVAGFAWVEGCRADMPVPLWDMPVCSFYQVWKSAPQPFSKHHIVPALLVTGSRPFARNWERLRCRRIIRTAPPSIWVCLRLLWRAWW